MYVLPTTELGELSPVEKQPELGGPPPDCGVQRVSEGLGEWSPRKWCMAGLPGPVPPGHLRWSGDRLPPRGRYRGGLQEDALPFDQRPLDVLRRAEFGFDSPGQVSNQSGPRFVDGRLGRGVLVDDVSAGEP